MGPHRVPPSAMEASIAASSSTVSLFEERVRRKLEQLEHAGRTESVSPSPLHPTAMQRPRIGDRVRAVHPYDEEGGGARTTLIMVCVGCAVGAVLALGMPSPPKNPSRL